MQILYLLVLGDESNVLYGKNLCFNANYRFTYEIINDDEVKVSWEIKDILPDNFFTTRKDNKNCCIDNISEIIGENGSGKTLVLKTLSKIIGDLTIDNEITSPDIIEKFILIYKINDKFLGKYIIIESENQSSWRKKRVYDFDCSGKNYYIFSDAETNKIEENKQNGLAIKTDLVYLCNHYCFNWNPLSFWGAFEDYSTAGRFMSDDYDNSHGDFSKVRINSHKYKEMERIIKLSNYLNKTNDKLSNTEEDYKQSIKDIVIKKVIIDYNIDIIDLVHKVVQQKIQNSSYRSRHPILSEIVNALDFSQLSRQADFFLFIVWGFIASCVLESINDDNSINNSESDTHKRIKNFCTLANTIKNKIIDKNKDIYEFKDIILETIGINSSLNTKTLFDNIFNFFIEQKETSAAKGITHNNNIAFDFSKENDINILLKIIELYILLNRRYSFMKFRYQPPISSGELSFLTLLSRLYDYLEKNSNSKNAIIFIDEAETTLHPKWQKALCQNTISFIDDYCEYKQRKLHLHIIFASHSPMLMSDVPTGNIVFLGKENSSDNPNPINTDWKTFAGDIFEIYQKGFFLKDGSIGNFALSKVDNVIQHISDGNISDDDRKIINMIGDGLITNYFHRIIDKQSSSSNDSQK